MDDLYASQVGMQTEKRKYVMQSAWKFLSHDQSGLYEAYITVTSLVRPEGVVGASKILQGYSS